MVEKRITQLPYIQKDDPFCKGLAPEFARSPIHRNRVYTVKHYADAALAGQPGSILEVGCGVGHVAYPLALAGLTVTGIDIDAPSIEAAKHRYQHPLITFECIDIKDAQVESYNAIVLTEVLEHVADYRSFLHLITDRMQPGAGLVLTVPNGSCWSERLCRPSYRLKTTPFGKPIVKAIKRMLGTRDVTTANELTPHVNFFSTAQLEALFSDCRLSVASSHGSFVWWPVTETFFSEHTLNEEKAAADFTRSQTAPFERCTLWSFLLRKSV